MSERGRQGRGVRLGLAVAMVAAVASAAGAAGPHERPADRSVADTLAPELARGPYHRVHDPIFADGYMLHFVVDSDFGTFEATGLGALRKLVREIHAIAELKKIKGTAAFGKQVVDSATSPLQFAGKLLTHPVDTLSGLPRGIYKGVEDVTTAVTTKRDPSQDSRMQTILLQSGKKREYAAALGVDPYSSNKVLQKELNSVAWAAALGSWTVTVATAPISGVASTVLTTTKMGDVVGDYLKVHGPAELRRRNQEKLAAMGLPADLITRYLDHPAFTPRHDTLLVEALARLGNARGRDVFLQAALGAEDETDASFFTTMAQILRGHHETVSPVTEISRAATLVVAQTAGGTALIPFPLDHGVWTERADGLTDELRAIYRPAGFNGRFDFWVLGRLSARARQQLAAKGIAAVEDVDRRIEIID